MGCCREGGADGVIMGVDSVEEGGGMEVMTVVASGGA
ncbi:hypothetical protein Tco_0249576, partial [Tanacetum coccineum]